MFDGGRIEMSVMKASDHGFSSARVSEIVERVRDSLYSSGPVVSTAEIGQAVLDVLSGEDFRSFARYAVQFLRPRSPTEFLQWLENRDSSSEGSKNPVEFRLMRQDGVQENIDRRAVLEIIRDQTQFRREAFPEPQVESVADTVVKAASELASSRVQHVLSETDLLNIIANSLLDIDEMAYFYCSILAKDIDSDSKLRGELRSLVDSTKAGGQ
jgi:transcriptional regulator NrdR family protein